MQDSSYAGFGEIDWKFTPAWKLTVGVRYSYDDKHGNEFLRLVTFGASFATPEQLGTLTPAWDETSFLVQPVEPGASAVSIGADGYGRRNLSGNWSAVYRHRGPGVGPESPENLLAYLKYTAAATSRAASTPAPIPWPPILKLALKRSMTSKAASRRPSTSG